MFRVVKDRLSHPKSLPFTTRKLSFRTPKHIPFGNQRELYLHVGTRRAALTNWQTTFYKHSLHNRPSPSLWTTTPPHLFRPILRVKFLTTCTPNFNISDYPFSTTTIRVWHIDGSNQNRTDIKAIIILFISYYPLIMI